MNLQIYYQNVRGIKTKVNDFALNILSSDYDIICITETWLDSSIGSEEVVDSRYIVFRQDREESASTKRHGGGVLMAVKRNIIAHRIYRDDSTAENIWVNLKLEDSNFSINICLTYIPPDVSVDVFAMFINRCQEICVDSTSKRHTLILGDFNIPSIEWSNGTGMNFCEYNIITNGQKPSLFTDFLHYTNFHQFNNVKNVINNRILDLAISDLPIEIEQADALTKIDLYHPPIEIIVKNLNTNPEYLSYNNSDFSLLLEPTTTRAEVDVLHSPSAINVSDFKLCRLKDNTEYPTYNFNKTDYLKCTEELNLVDWSRLNLLDCNEFLQQFYNTLWSVIEKHTPRKKIKNKYPVWFSDVLIHQIKEKNKFRKRAKRYGNPRDYDTFSILRSRVKLGVRTCHQSYISSIETSLKQGTKALWSYAKSKRMTGVIPKIMHLDGTVVDSGREISELFSSYFSSVFDKQTLSASTTYVKDFSNFTLNSVNVSLNDVLQCLKSLDINKGPGPDAIPPIFVSKCADSLAAPLHFIFNKSLNEGIFPDLWKIARISPIFKSGDKSNVSNYRPISLLSCFGKVFEKLIYKHIFNHYRHILSPHQHGFVSNRSTITNLTEFVDFLSTNFNSRTQVDAVYTDFRKAFDKVSHPILIHKLEKSGFHGNLLRWLISYISNRSQFVSVNGYESFPKPVTSGVPQGSHLGPLLFIIFINDLISRLSCRSLLYADDLKIFQSVKTQMDCEALQMDLDALSSWCSENSMELNVSKCNIITFTKNIHKVNYSYTIGGERLLRKDSIRDLGVILDSKLLFSDHIQYIVNKSNKLLGLITRITKPFKNPNSFRILYYSLVRSTLEYGSVIWSPHYQIYINKLESVQKKYMRTMAYITGEHRNLNSYPERLIRFGEVSLVKRRTIIDVVTLYKIINNRYDSSLVSLINLNAGVRSTRSSDVFRIGTHRNNTSFFSPISRMTRSYNERCKGQNIDIFSNGMTEFRSAISLYIPDSVVTTFIVNQIV